MRAPADRQNMRITQRHSHHRVIKMLRMNPSRFSRQIQSLLLHMDSGSVTWKRTRGTAGSYEGNFTGTYGKRGEVHLEVGKDRNTISFPNKGIEETYLIPMAQVIADAAVAHVLVTEKAAKEKAESDARRERATTIALPESIFIDDVRTSLDTLSIEQLNEIIAQATERLDMDAKPDKYKNGDMTRNYRALEAADKCLAEIRRRTPAYPMGPQGMIDGNYIHRTQLAGVRAA